MRLSPSDRVAVYRRRVAASLDRVWENVLDWEHLPWLHSGSFVDIEPIESGAWGWRARIGLPPADARQEILLELLIERSDRRYVSRTVEGPGAGTEIWTHLDPDGEEATAIRVEFFVPGVAEIDREMVGAVFTRLYRRLWDEDERMMIERESALGRRGPDATASGASASIDLGLRDALSARLPTTVELAGRRYRVAEIEGELVVWSTECPHMLGPLDGDPDAAGRVRCPWHGYEYDVRTRRCVDPPGLRLARAPEVQIDPATGRVSLGLARASAT